MRANKIASIVLDEHKRYIFSKNDITVKVTYTVSLGGIEVDDETFKAICNSYDNGSQLGSDCWIDDEDAYEASDWLSDHIKESDAMEWEYEIEDLDVDD